MPKYPPKGSTNDRLIPWMGLLFLNKLFHCHATFSSSNVPDLIDVIEMCVPSTVEISMLHTSLCKWCCQRRHITETWLITWFASVFACLAYVTVRVMHGNFVIILSQKYLWSLRRSLVINHCMEIFLSFYRRSIYGHYVDHWSLITGFQFFL